MKYLLLGCLLLFSFLSCSKGLFSKNDTITYELTGGSIIEILNYYDATGAPRTISNYTSNHWTITFENKAGRPRTLVLQATIISGSNQTIKGVIKVNGNIEATEIVQNGFLQLIHNLN